MAPMPLVWQIKALNSEGGTKRDYPPIPATSLYPGKIWSHASKKHKHTFEWRIRYRFNIHPFLYIVLAKSSKNPQKHKSIKEHMKVDRKMLSGLNATKRKEFPR